MKKLTSLNPSLRRFRPICLSLGWSAQLFPLALFLLLFGLPFAQAPGAELTAARVSQVIRDVKLLPSQAAPRPANVRDEVRNGTAVRTGVDSRAELTFTDQTLTRLGANTIFGFNEGTRNLRLSSGAMLLRVPKNDGGARINTATVTAAITGTTIMMEYHPDHPIKFIVLEGTGRIFRNDRVGESVLVHAGQMLIVDPKGKGLPDPVDVDVKRLMETSHLVTDFDPLPSTDLIGREILSQTTDKRDGDLIETNLVIYGSGTAVSLVDATDQAKASEERQPTSSPGAGAENTPTPPTLGEAATYNGGTGNWSNPDSWTPAVVPIKGNRAEKLDVTLSSGRLTQDIVGGVNLSTLFMSGGTLILANPLSLEAGLQFTGGNITGGTLNVAGTSKQSAVMGVNGTTINNSGDYAITLTGGNAFSGGATFNNSGTLTLHADGGTVTFNNVLNNTGAVSAESGTFNLTGGGVFSGAASAADGAFLQFNANYSFTDGAAFTGSGMILFANNTASTFSGTIDNSGRLFFNSSDLVLDGDLTLTGGGAINLVSSDRIRGSGVLINVDNVIQGETDTGNLGNNEIGIVNQSDGVISANISDLVLNVDPGAGGLTNQGLMEASNGGILLLNGNGGQGFTNTGATISALNGSQVQLGNGVSINGGALTTAGTGQFVNLNTATLTNLTNAGTFIGNNSSTTTIAGTITNKGSISLNSTANATDLVLAGNVTLTGGGTINLKRSDRIRGSGILTNVNNIIHGETNPGSFGNNQIGIVNRAAGLIDANLSGSRLVIDPNSASGLTNLGVMQASNGGFLRLTGNGGGAFTNTGGLIQALAGSEVELTGGATIIGGILTTSNGGIVRNLDSATLNGISLTGTFIANNNSTTTLVGTITNTGDILLNSTTNTTDLVINNNVTLTGGRTLTLLNSARVTGSGTLFVGGADGTAFTILGDTSGGTSLGNNDLALVNRSGGLIDANGNGLKLTVDPRNGDGLINQGILRASGGGILVLTGNGGGAFANGSGLITALTGSEVQLTANVSITGGILSTTGTGVIRNLDTATLNSLTLSGAFLANNHSTTNLTGTITNTGSISLNSTGNATDLSISGNVTLTGGGIVKLVNSDRILGSGTLTNTNNTIQGETSGGTIGNNAIAIVNRGLINANVSGKSLNLDPGGVGLTNQGMLEASNGGILLLDGNGGQAFTNTGATISALSGSRVQLTNGVSINGGTLTTAGTGTFVNLNNATLTNLTNAGAFIANNHTTTKLVGTITNTGSVSLNSTLNTTDLLLAGNVTLTGGGTVTLANADRVRGSGILTNANNVIQGDTSNGGSLGNKEIGVLNQSAGVINANHSGSALNVQPNPAIGLVNHGLMEATHGGILQLNGYGSSTFVRPFANSGGTIRADGASSLVRLTNNAIVTGGTLSLLNGGSMTIAGAFNADLINGNSGVLTVTSGSVSAINGINFNGNNGTVTIGGSLSLTAPSVTLGSAAGQINGALLNGGNATPNSGLPGGNGGTLNVTATGGDILVDADLEASTGANGSNSTVATGGAGGTVKLTANSGAVTVNNRIQVSHKFADRRSSAAGGNITLKSGKASGVAINVSSTAQLLSLLDAAAPGPGGKIVIQATAASGTSQMNIGGNLQADRGTIDARHSSDRGVINLTNANVHADTVKVAALGNNGALHVGGGSISADTTLQLYAPNGNGQVVFVGNVSLTGASTKSIAGDSVTINNGVLVNVTGPAASVYVNNNVEGQPKANYTGFGGNGQTTGTFTGSGANNPQLLSNAPPLGTAPGG